MGTRWKGIHPPTPKLPSKQKQSGGGEGLSKETDFCQTRRQGVCLFCLDHFNSTLHSISYFKTWYPNICFSNKSFHRIPRIKEMGRAAPVEARKGGKAFPGPLLRICGLHSLHVTTSVPNSFLTRLWDPQNNNRITSSLCSYFQKRPHCPVNSMNWSEPKWKGMQEKEK